ncbi:ATPase family associated with various cellular activities (AAA) [Marvinbryantia formatexigens DSM 14469]|uniref:ATPase family associated with various cellular activities (AAA) n=1 Tax=Marvinbryantia formatexigens DSM 14469 TaxID=478749 RepID=C6L8Y3_9FIRM|nr:AAA family ATPase [Marvinbryantia formatexigens]EET62722.1 ATPase family associated with various cellular activities (AAA) [Marvinbryantia formatexigens DSM 14469]UWO23090.1 AAA family ATPase [Marvinbryantia formatexigens DSM 14469]SDF98883.1 MoxR-like ATPase [Marvinbryantia formatexigens]
MEIIRHLKENIAKVMIGNERTTELVLACVLAKGHVLLQDVPGTGKTMLAKSLAKSIDADFGRIQFTPDMLPSDITGLNYFDAKSGEFVFAKGPVFCNILLADEINRATPKTQSSLLECMAERQVTVDGTTRVLEEPFLVIATQNPLETLGTFPLPEAQKDRFLMQISMEDLTPPLEQSLLERFLAGHPLEELEPVCEKKDIAELQMRCSGVYIHEDLLKYMIRLVHATRENPQVEHGVSPRGSLAFARAAQAFAMVQGRDYVVPEDIKTVAVPVLAHRLGLSAAEDSDRARAQVIRELLSRVPLPTEEWSRR